MTKIARQPVTSSRVTSIGHDGKYTMEVEFNTGAVYRYAPVAWQTALELITSPTVGKDIQAIIDNKLIKCEKQ